MYGKFTTELRLFGIFLTQFSQLSIRLLNIIKRDKLLQMGAGASISECERFVEVVKISTCYDAAATAPDCNTRAKISDSDLARAVKSKGLSLLIPTVAMGTTSPAADAPPALLPYLRSLFMAHVSRPNEQSVSVHTFWDIVESLFGHILSDFDNSRLEVWNHS